MSDHLFIPSMFIVCIHTQKYEDIEAMGVMISIAWLTVVNPAESSPTPSDTALCNWEEKETHFPKTEFNKWDIGALYFHMWMVKSP